MYVLSFEVITIACYDNKGKTNVFSPIHHQHDASRSGRIRMKFSVGKQVPDFTLSTSKNIDVTLSTVVQEGRVVLVFYRGFW